MKLTRSNAAWRYFCLCMILVFSHVTTVFSANVQVAPDVQLTAQEQAWVASHPAIRLGVDPDWPPIEFFSTEQGYQGVPPEYVRFIGKKLQLAMQQMVEYSL